MPENSPATPLPRRESAVPSSYHRIGLVATAEAPVAVWRSTELADAVWDDFLRSTPCGQFQQSSLWAQYKAGEGWTHHRIVLTKEERVVGGFQILWKRSRYLRIGYVSKAPVERSPDAPLGALLAEQLVLAARELRLAAMIVQLPDESAFPALHYEEKGFLRSNPMGVYEATYLLDLEEDLAILRARMSSSLRRNIRAGKRRGVLVREGTEADLGRFFALMATACRRLNTPPNPPSVEALTRLWRIFAPTGSIRVIFAECEGQTVAAKLNLHFGARLVIWKKGWDGTHGDWHPNEVLEDATFEWGREVGFAFCDFGSFGRAAAEYFADGRTAPEELISSVDAYHLRFSGRPKILPPALVYLPNPALRWCYRNLYSRIKR